MVALFKALGGGWSPGAPSQMIDAWFK